MRRAQGAAFVVMAMGVLASLPGAASAGQKIAIFPIDMSFPKSEDDFFTAQQGPSPDEQRRLAKAEEELVRLVSADGRYEPIDLKPLATEITAAQPLYNCNGCELDIASKVKAELVMTSVIEKISETHLSLNVALVDVTKNQLLKNMSVLIQGNTDESWMHGVRWLAKNRLFAEGKSQ
jgi:hypothetical protein